MQFINKLLTKKKAPTLNQYGCKNENIISFNGKRIQINWNIFLQIKTFFLTPRV